MQNDKLVTNSFGFSSVSFSLEEVPCSVQPLSFDESLCIGCGTCARVCQCDILFPSDKKGTHPIVASPSQPREVCADYFTIKNHPLPIIKSATGNFFISLLIHF